ncbi:MAG: hypothetical protein V4648_10035 [Bacteroidota bacterium]
MKKLVLLFVLLPLLHSCSSDDNTGVSESPLTTNGTLLKKAVMTLGTDVISEDYFYNGNKIDKIIRSDGSRFQYTYTGNLISKNDYYQNDVFKVSEQYTYDFSQKIIEVKTFNYTNPSVIVRRADFVYNPDGTVWVKEYQGDTTNQTNLVRDKKIFLFSNGDVQKIEQYLVVNGNNETRTLSYTYDTKNTIGNSVMGFNKVKNWNAFNSGNSHNVVTEYTMTTENATTSTYNYSYTYNSYDYPVVTTLPGGVGTFEYFYQQP